MMFQRLLCFGPWSVLTALMVSCATTHLPPSDDPAHAPNPLMAFEAAGSRGIETAAVTEALPIVLKNATVLTAAGQRYAPGYLVMRAGLIERIGAGEPPDVPDAQVINATGHVITPGLIDAHSHLGVYPAPSASAHSDGNEMTSPITAGVWAEHGVWPQDPGFELAVAGGVTTIQVLPGSANLVGGRGITLHLVPQRGSRAMGFPGALPSLKMACGENPKRVYGHRKQAPSTRMGNLRGQRMAFLKAREYQEKWQRYERKHLRYEENRLKSGGNESGSEAEKDPPKPPERDLGLETLVGVLEGRILVQIHCYRADDMLNMLQLADEMGFQIRAFHHAIEAYKIRDILVERNVAVATWADWWGFKLEAYDGIQQNAALVAEAGGRAIIHSDSREDIQHLNQEAAKAYWAGVHSGITLDGQDALRWITANPAWALGIDDQVGTLEVGKRADVVVWDRNPLSVYAKPRWVFIDGILRYDQKRREAPWSDFMLGQEVQP